MWSAESLPSFGHWLARVVDLRREHDLLAASVALGEPPADDRLGETVTVAVDVGGVEEVEPDVEAVIHDPERVVLLGLHTAAGAHPEVHRAQHSGLTRRPVRPRKR